MDKSELNIHFEYVRKMQEDIQELNARIENDKSDDASNIRSSYENIRKEFRCLLSRTYDAETV